MTRSFTHARTGRPIQVLEGSRTERLVEADDNWTEDKPKTSGGSRGSGNTGRRRGSSRKGSDGDGGDEG